MYRTPFTLEQLSTIFTPCHLSSSIAFLMKLGKTHVKNTEKPTFLILKDDSILPTALSESPITSLKFHVPNEINVINNLREMLDLILQEPQQTLIPT